MKIAIIGYSGSGKSTLALKLAEKFNIPILHFDTVQFLPNWDVRDDQEKIQITKDFLDNHTSWIIDGNYSKLFYDRRMAEADIIIFLTFNRFSCLCRAYRRYLKYKNTTRPDMAEGCNEKFDLAFVKWILWEGRSKKVKERYQNVINDYKSKVIILKNQHQLDAYIGKITDN